MLARFGMTTQTKRCIILVNQQLFLCYPRLINNVGRGQCACLCRRLVNGNTVERLLGHRR